MTALRNYARDEDSQDILLEVAILLTDDRPQVCMCVYIIYIYILHMYI